MLKQSSCILLLAMTASSISIFGADKEQGDLVRAQYQRELAQFEREKNQKLLAQFHRELAGRRKAIALEETFRAFDRIDRIMNPSAYAPEPSA